MTEPKSDLVAGGILVRVPFHPVLIAAAPAMIMLAANIDQLNPSAGLRAILFSVLAGIALMLVLRILTRSWRKAALLTSLFVIFFFSYGQLYTYLRNQGEWGWAITRHRYMLPASLILFAGSIFVLFRLKEHIGALTSVFNLVSVVAIAMPLLQILGFQVRSSTAASRLASSASQETVLQLPVGHPAPDIYYIIPDSYDRADYLLTEYGFDNRPFIETLEEIGFYVAKCSRSNYNRTRFSLPSSLNMNYLEALSDEFQPGTTETHALGPLIKDSRVRRELEALGYSVVGFETGFIITQLDDADYYYELPKEGSLAQLFSLEGVNGFEAMLIKSSGARVLTDAGTATGILTAILPDLDRPRSIYRDRTLYVLDQLAPDKVPSLRGPKFVFVHLVSPHFPYVIGRNGEFVDREISDSDREAYINQLIYLNKRLEEILRGIIETADSPPIVILQADHGNGAARGDAVEMLNAYFLPDYEYGDLYPEISPVNTFRLIFNLYFGGDFKLLNDASYNSNSDAPFEFRDIPETQPGCRGESVDY
ncbi:MAG: hypothetical protein IIA89_07570 [Chloroflexi bacterium]|nr:hypothetical protein [Chloroflexota bacterium]